jgi:hypothetical protein
LGALKELLLLMCIDHVLATNPTSMVDVIIQAIIIGIELYVDPSSTILNTGTIITSYKTSQVRLISFSVSGIVTTALMMATGADFSEQLRNMRNSFVYNGQMWSLLNNSKVVFAILGVMVWVLNS